MRLGKIILLVNIICVLCLNQSISAKGEESFPKPWKGKKIIIATKAIAPFVFKKKSGVFTGISIDLLVNMANQLGFQYELKEMELDEILHSLKKGTIDMGIAAITITAQREKILDFSHAYYSTGLAIAIPRKNQGGFLSTLGQLISVNFVNFLKAIFTLFVVLMIVGAIIWKLEKEHPQSRFEKDKTKGLFSGFWWSAVTMTTVGYGDKIPLTFKGRMVAIIWMFTAIIIISSFTASITSALTVNTLQSRIQGPQDLVKIHSGTVKNSTSELYLKNRQITYSNYNSTEKGLNALLKGEVDAFVYDAPILRYLVNKDYKGKIQVLPNTFLRQDYGIALVQKSPLRELINQSLLIQITKPQWKNILYRYLGKND